MFALLTAIIFLGRVCAVRGELAQAAERYQIAIQKGGQVPILAIAHHDLAMLHYEWNDFDASRTEIKLALESNRYGGNSEVQAAIYLVLARLESARGDFAGMEVAYEQLRQMVENAELPRQVQQRIQDSRVDLALAGGDLPLAQSLAGSSAPQADTHPFYRFLGLAGARLALARRGIRLTASQVLGDCYDQADAGGMGVWRTGGADLASAGSGYSGSCPYCSYGCPAALPAGWISADLRR